MSTPTVVIIIGPKATSLAGEDAAARFVASAPYAESITPVRCAVIRGNEVVHFDSQAALFEHFHPSN